MNRTTDVMVIGSGMAGLMAALAATQSNCKTAILCEGMGNLSISGGTIDLLGYDVTGVLLKDPWKGIMELPPTHPYSLLGKNKIEAALNAFLDCCSQNRLDFKISRDENGNEINTRLPTVFGTLKPVWMLQDDIDAQKLEKAQKILVVGIQGFRDCRPKLIVEQLKRYPEWKEKDFATLILPPPFSEKGRSLNALDIARTVDRERGRKWIKESAKGKGEGFDLALLPPVLGARADSSFRKEFASVLGCPYVEMQCIPPGVGGLRIRDALIHCLEKRNVEFFENARVTSAVIKDGNCEGIEVEASGRTVRHSAKAYVLATGGILGGGLLLGEGTAKEAILGLPLEVPENVDDWTEFAIFGKHFLTSLGVKADSDLRPLAQINVKNIQNVFFAGRTLGGYDYASEKSGHGVAIATGWQAGLSAASVAGCPALVKNADGAEK